jgi:sortase A
MSPGTPRLPLVWIERGLVALGIVLLGLVLRSCVVAHAFQSAASRELDAERSLVGPPEALAPGGARGRLIGRLEIPRLALSAIVAEGAGNATLDRAIGHLPRTALPGDPGNCALAGHRDTFLRGIGSTRAGDRIRLVTPRATYVYRVDWTRVVGPERVDVVGATKQPCLTLVTCYPFHVIGPAPRRYVVRALEVASYREAPPKPSGGWLSALRTLFAKASRSS